MQRLAQVKIASPNQIGFASAWGGPVAATYFLRQNYLTLGKPEAAKWTLIGGLALCIALLALLPILPKKFPPGLIPLLLGGAADILSKNTQMEKEEIKASEDYVFESKWRIFWVSSALFIAFAVFAVMTWTVLDIG